MRMKILMEKEGLPYNAARNITFNSRLAQELEKWAESRHGGDTIHDLLFRAYFADMKNIGKRDVLLEIAEQAGLPADEAMEVLVSRSFKAAVDTDWKRCAEIGVTAVPTFVTGSRGVVGAQPYEVLEKLVLDASRRDEEAP
jgi:predicted DsbA family dithiol-disulfide isomerase